MGELRWTDAKCGKGRTIRTVANCRHVQAFLLSPADEGTFVTSEQQKADRNMRQTDIIECV